MKLSGKSRTGSKVILFGEHFVLYNQPALALPFTACGVNVEVKSHFEDAVVSKFYTGVLSDAPDLFLGLKQLINNLKSDLKIDEPCLVSIDSEIPFQRGMGSSAAISVGIIKSFYDFVGLDVDEELMRKRAHESENVHHSNASGIDIETVLSKTPIQFQTSKPMVPINTHLDAELMLVDSNILGSTSAAVQHVAEVFKSNPNKKYEILKAYEELFEKAKYALTNNQPQLVGKLMSQNHELLKAVGVSDPKIDEWIDLAINHGALGGKITGGGLGGCFLILTGDPHTSEAIKQLLNKEELHVSILDMKGL